MKVKICLTFLSSVLLTACLLALCCRMWFSIYERIQVNTPNPFFKGDSSWSDEFEHAHKNGVMFDITTGLTNYKYIYKDSLSHSTKCNVIASRKEADEARNFANLAHRFGWFETVSDARRKGWNKPTAGATQHKVGARSITIVSNKDGEPVR